MNTADLHALLSNATFLLHLISIDRELAEKTRRKRCPHCGGALHFACYRRKIRLGESIEDFNLCLSLCCEKHDCRRRTNPQSVRFCGRSPFPLGVIVLAELFSQGPSKTRILRLCKILAVSERAVRNWLKGWRKLSSTSWWRERSTWNLPEWQDSALFRVALFFDGKWESPSTLFCAILSELSLFEFRFCRYFDT
jgi:hypothetical protein